MSDEFVHPHTGEVLTLDVVRGRLGVIEEQMSPLFAERSVLRKAYAELAELAEIPRPRYRTRKQEAVTHCPRCGTRIEEEA